MHVRILGPLEILHHDRAVVLRGRRERTLLLLLVVSANRVVPSERLAEELWADNPPAGAAEALRVTSPGYGAGCARWRPTRPS